MLGLRTVKLDAAEHWNESAVYTTLPMEPTDRATGAEEVEPHLFSKYCQVYSFFLKVP